MTDAHGVARDQLRAFIERIERLLEEKKTIEDDIKDIYGEAKGTGFIPAMIKKVIALRKKDEQQRMEEEAILDTYLAALGMLSQHDLFEPETAPTTNKPAMALRSPRQAAEAVSERAAFTDATIAPVLVEADEAEAVAGVLGQPETIPALTVQHDGVNVGGPERAGVTDRRDDHLNSQSAGEISAPFSSLVTREAHEVVTANSEIDPSEDRQEVQSLGGDADANTGGDHVAAHPDAATHQAGASFKAPPATHGIVMETVPPVPMKTLPYAHCFPDLSKTAYQRLADDISMNGVNEPIVRMSDVIVDGWNRYNAARSLGIEYPVIEYGGDDILLDLIEWQRGDRDWSPSQERKIADALAKEIPDRADDIMAAFQIEHEGEPA